MLTIADAATLLRVDTRTVRRWINNGTLTCHTVSARNRYIEPLQVSELMETRGPR